MSHDPDHNAACRIIAVTGASGSGKTTIARLAATRLNAPILAMDNYYRDLSHLPPADRHHVNFDHPDAFDAKRLADDLARLRAGLPAKIPRYDFATHTRHPQTSTLQPARLLLLEGILCLHFPGLRKHIDFSVYIDTPPDLCLARRLRRDVLQRGRSTDSVLNQYLASVRPMRTTFIEPQKHFAHLILNGESPPESLAPQIA